jgi:hypothetical protein
VQAMKTADLNRLLLVSALVSDLCCPTYNPRQSLARDSNLARAAARYKVDSVKVTAVVRAELSRPKSNVKEENKSAKKPNASTVQRSRASSRGRSNS